MTVFLENVGLGRHLLQSADKHPDHDDEDMDACKMVLVIFPKVPSSDSMKER